MAELTLFPRLPVEIQLAIQELAARSHDHCDHFLTLGHGDSFTSNVTGRLDNESFFDKDAGLLGGMPLNNRQGSTAGDYALVTVVDDPQRMRGALLGCLQLVFATA